MNGRTRVGVLASGAGTNLRALLDAAADPAYLAQVVVVISNRRECGALEVAARGGIPALSMPVSDYGHDTQARDRAILERLHESGVELLVCAGYDRVLSDVLLTAFDGAILNVHPSLLPAFGGGMHAVEDALAAGVKITGCTVHLLARGAVDGGPIVLQAAVPVEDGDDVERLRERIHREEWRLLPEAVALWASGRLLEQDGAVRVLPAPRVTRAAG